MESLTGPANYFLFGFFPMIIFSIIIPMVGVGCFTYIMAKRVAPLVKAAPDFRLNRFPERVFQVIKIWLLQWRQPRYRTAGILHIMIFVGFLVLSIRSTELVVVGISNDFVVPGFDGFLGSIYNVIKDYAATMVLIACVIAGYRRAIVKPKRYAVPEKYGHDHTGEALFVLGMICTLMITESLFEASEVAASSHHVFLAPLSLVWFEALILSAAPEGLLQAIHIVSYYLHDLTYFSFLCFLPMGKHFHVITSVFNVFFMRLDKGNTKPVRNDVSDEQLDDLESFGVKKIEDFTWKHLLDFYSCADCGRCSDQCPANTVGRPLSPRFISIKGRDKLFENYPLRGEFKESKPLIGDIYEEDEIWSCTTCGACEEECPLGIEYIDKIVDLRRAMVDEGMVPQTLQKPLSALEKRGNAWGKMEKKRADWASQEEFAETCTVKVLDKKETAETLYFVDSISSYDDRMQDLARATAKVLTAGGTDFGVLGKKEKDSGNEVRRFGEEMLFQTLKEQNIDAILGSGAKNIVTADPHAFNAIKNDYNNDELPPVEHLTQYVARQVKAGALSFKPVEDSAKVYTYHDPCYLGRHNGVYDDPRDAMDAIPGLRRVDMEKSRDRSFCCSGGGLMLFYEPEEEERMSVLRVQMAAEAGANVIVTACPFCLVNMEDAIKVAKMEDTMEAIDFSELIARHINQ
ncbi:MAG: (Fe-S)-binding protein [Thermodesulfobacteriota bacterium]|nr:(Fe-S)-binding protein [Thermodesulfobacteriota bacterium]